MRKKTLVFVVIILIVVIVYFSVARINHGLG